MQQNPKVTIIGGSMTDVGTVASVSHGSGYSVDMSGVVMTRVGKVFEERDQIQALGLRSDAPRESVVAVLQAVVDGALPDAGSVQRRAEEVGLAQYVGTAAGLSTMADLAIKWRDSGHLQAVLAALVGG
jgi:hypothetical protein